MFSSYPQIVASGALNVIRTSSDQSIEPVGLGTLHMAKLSNILDWKCNGLGLTWLILHKIGDPSVHWEKRVEKLVTTDWKKKCD